MNAKYLDPDMELWLGKSCWLHRQVYPQVTSAKCFSVGGNSLKKMHVKLSAKSRLLSELFELLVLKVSKFVH